MWSFVGLFYGPPSYIQAILSPYQDMNGDIETASANNLLCSTSLSSLRRSAPWRTSSEVNNIRRWRHRRICDKWRQGHQNTGRFRFFCYPVCTKEPLWELLPNYLHMKEYRKLLSNQWRKYIMIPSVVSLACDSNLEFPRQLRWDSWDLPCQNS
jgi:hypothetical protein